MNLEVLDLKQFKSVQKKKSKAGLDIVENITHS